MSVTAVEIARATDEVARAVDGVLDLDAGAVGEFATYGTGGRVRGVTVKHGPPARVGLRLVIAYGHPLPELVDDVRSRVTERVAALSDATRVIVDVHIADVTDQIPTAALPAETEAAS